jgi:hypothetical protein
MKISIYSIIVVFLVCYGISDVFALPWNFSLISYKGKSFTPPPKEGKGTIVILLPTEIKGVRRTSEYRGVYGAMVSSMKDRRYSPFDKFEYVVDYYSNYSNYSKSNNYIVSANIEHYSSTPNIDGFKCTLLKTIIQSKPYTEDSTVVYEGYNCDGAIDIRIMAQIYFDRFDKYIYAERYDVETKTSLFFDKPKYDPMIDSFLGFSDDEKK